MKNNPGFIKRGTWSWNIVAMLLLLNSTAIAAERTTAGPFDVLYLDGVVVGHPDDAVGGYPKRGLLQGTQGRLDSSPVWRTLQPSSVEFSQVEFSFGAGWAPGWYGWIAAELGMPAPRTFALLRLNGAARSSQVAGSARLVGLEFPALDRAVIGNARFRASVAILDQPQVSLSLPGTLSVPRAMPVMQPSTHEFRLSLQTLETATLQAVSISAITVTREMPMSTVPGPLAAAPFVVRLPQSVAHALHAWYTDSVLNDGFNSTRHSGVLEYLNGKGAVVASLGLVNVGILGFAPISDKGVPLVEVTLFCDQVVPQFGSLAAP